MSSPNSATGGGFHPVPQYASTLGYTNPRAQRLATMPPTLPVSDAEEVLSNPTTFTRHRMRRGMSFDAIRGNGIISSYERSTIDFEKLPCDDDDIKQYPRKLRPYYERMGCIKEHYEEVDCLLSGELPSIIASAFRAPPADHSRSYNSVDVHGPDVTIHQAWQVRPHPVRRPTVDEIGESTPLILAERESQKERIAKLALHSELNRLVFSVVMIASFTQVFIEAFNRAVWGTGEDGPVDLSGIGMATMLATIGTKSVLWVWCSRIPSSGVQALAQDAENDVILNITSLAFPWLGTIVGSHLLDPIGGMVISLYIIIEWIKTLLQNFANLSGRAASGDQYTRMLYMVTRFNPVLHVADLECYHIGDDLVVEVDVILPNTSLHFAHDVGETIQVMLENLDGVLRAYVHCDYSSANPAQHRPRPRVDSGGPSPIELRTASPEPAPNGTEGTTLFASSILSATPTPGNPFPDNSQAHSVVFASP
ncbi:uncharacterized protein EHS24_008127 [Apiotrichum porosum]|uniref:Cation efflux protein transmembrane domain-containing protein n=1 Tax=Apiotrichum porosum TaxID=105984 RepID=A0A427XSW8_9TREE|nr:uncharacterized protein EHS24_008127 [Apiotrichum porosum]RSH81930.1 hypothetical protein EHS24_008127 [Apiotrichum porosum]